jgi:glycosyltransferase involved in cell wall biosynthesis
MARTNQQADVWMSDEGFIQIRPKMNESPRVSIVIPTRGDAKRIWGVHTCLVEHAVNSILRQTTYTNYEIVVVHDYKDGAPIYNIDLGADSRVKVVPYQAPFNFSDKCNVGVKASSGDVIVLLNDDVQLVSPDWLETFVAMLQYEGVGMVGPMLLLEDGRIQTTVRPIAGTRKRGATLTEDNALAEDLLQDPKEIAEHIMLVDLGRNDLGRVCVKGSVKVDELMVIERYSHVMHIVSNVIGELDPDKTAWDLLKACFPAGTVSGAPKIRAMEIINELEPERRGPYSGVYGYYDFEGQLNTAIAIRTMVVRPQGNNQHIVTVQAGAGLVADSDPEKEYEETINKARGLLEAIRCLI